LVFAIWSTPSSRSETGNVRPVFVFVRSARMVSSRRSRFTSRHVRLRRDLKRDIDRHWVRAMVVEGWDTGSLVFVELERS
jgi:hypothetical protein